MATFYFSHNAVKRACGGSCVAVAAYNAGEKLDSFLKPGFWNDFRDKEGVLYKEMCTPSYAPAWSMDRNQAWRRLEERSKSPRAFLANSFLVYLPAELTLEQNIFLVRDFVRDQFTEKGIIADYAIHAPDPRGDARNIHLHLLTPLRKVTDETFGPQFRYDRCQWRAQLSTWLQAWAHHANYHLERHGHQERLDDRSHRARGLKPAPHMHVTKQPKVDANVLRDIRAKMGALPRAPLVKFAVLKMSGNLKTLQISVKHSALNKLTNPALSRGMRSDFSTTGWSCAAVEDWISWGKKAPQRFYGVWPELAPDNFKVTGGQHHDVSHPQP